MGTAAGSANFGIVFVWIVWWGLLMGVLLPLGGRLWCLICPVPAPGEWVQRGALVRPPGDGNGASPPAGRPRRIGGGLRFTLGWRWPDRLRTIWLQNAGFVVVALFSVLILTRPRVSAWLLLAFLVGGILLAILYERRAFCRYVCPVGGFIGLYSLAAPLELRVRDPLVCQDHRTKDCYLGNAAGYGCPWLEQPWTMARNAACGLCGECLRTCPKDNVAVWVRPPGADLVVAEGWRLDEAYKAFIMLACAAIYPLVLLGPWGWLKEWANLGRPQGFGIYALAFLGLTLLVVPGLHLAAAAATRSVAGLQGLPVRRLFVALAYPLVPLGLAAWIAFTLSFVFANALVCHSRSVGPLRLGLEPARDAGFGLASLADGMGSQPASNHPYRGDGRSHRNRGCGPAKIHCGPRGRVGAGDAGVLPGGRDDLLPLAIPGGCGVRMRGWLRGDSTDGHRGWWERSARLLTLALVLGLPAGLLAARLGGPGSSSRTIELVARQPASGGWSRERIVVSRGERVRLRIRSEDVVHGFAIGRLGVDAGTIEPGKPVEVEFVADQPGEFTFYCTTWCDPNHPRMRGILEVREAGRASAPAPPSTPDIALRGLDAPREASAIPARRPSVMRGQGLFNAQCATCHGGRGEGAGRAPAIGRHEALQDWSPVQVFELLGGATPTGVKRMSSGAAIHPQPMRGWTDQDRWDAVAYLWSLGTTPDQVDVRSAPLLQELRRLPRRARLRRRSWRQEPTEEAGGLHQRPNHVGRNGKPLHGEDPSRRDGHRDAVLGKHLHRGGAGRARGLPLDVFPE